jgi:hypothetical protein
MALFFQLYSNYKPKAKSLWKTIIRTEKIKLSLIRTIKKVPRTKVLATSKTPPKQGLKMLAVRIVARKKIITQRIYVNLAIATVVIEKPAVKTIQVIISANRSGLYPGPVLKPQLSIIKYDQLPTTNCKLPTVI